MSECKHGTPFYQHCEECSPALTCPEPMTYEEEARLRKENAKLTEERAAPRGDERFATRIAIKREADALAHLVATQQALSKSAAELTRLRADLAAVERERDAFRRALNEIAAFGDTVASAHLKRYGSYAAFDEPGSVRIARAALENPHG